MLTREQIIRAAETGHSSNAVLNAADYLRLDETRRKIRSGDRESIKDAILFLEVDPWYFGSGYLKERLTNALKGAPLTEPDKERIRQVIISAASGHNRREFRRYCRLAAVVTTSEFEETLRQMARNPDARSRGKFSYLLQYLDQHRVH